MTQPTSPYEIEPPSPRRLLITVTAAVVGAALVLFTVALLAEYGIDPSGIGEAVGLTAMQGPTRTIEITDVIGGNETYREVEIPEFGQPVPLPNPAVHQDEPEVFATRTVQSRCSPSRKPKSRWR